MNDEVKVNSFKAWILASRPKTLAAAVAPVLVGAALGWRLEYCFSSHVADITGAEAYVEMGFKSWLDCFMYFQIPSLMLAGMCLLFAVLMQIDANFINDLYDYLKGTDGEDRLGPKRAMAQGWITKKAMYIGIAIVTALACIVGLVMLYKLYMDIQATEVVSPWYQPTYNVLWTLCMVGVFSVLFAYSYTSGPFPLSYHGLGDVAVIAFFGHVAVYYTAYVMTYDELKSYSIPVFVGIAVGMVVDTLLIVNNYRDRDTDKRDGKNTLVAMFGEKFGRLFYLFIGIGAVVVMVYGLCNYTENNMSRLIIALAYIPYIIVHSYNYVKLKQIRQGKALNVLIGKSSMAMLLFAVTTVLLLLFVPDLVFEYSLVC